MSWTITKGPAEARQCICLNHSRVGVLRRSIAVAGMAAALMLVASQARAVQLSPAMVQMYAAVEAAPPTAGQMMICYGFQCRRRAFLYFSPADRAALTAIMAKGKTN